MTSSPPATPADEAPCTPCSGGLTRTRPWGCWFVGVFVAFGLAMAGLELAQNNRPDYFFVALFVFIAGRAAWTMWRQYPRIRHW